MSFLVYSNIWWSLSFKNMNFCIDINFHGVAASSRSWQLLSWSKFSTFYKTWMFITMFTKSQQYSLSWTNWISNLISFRSSIAIIFPSMTRFNKWALHFKLSNKNAPYISHLLICCISHTSHPPWLNHPNNSRLKEEFIKLLVICLHPPVSSQGLGNLVGHRSSMYLQILLRNIFRTTKITPRMTEINSEVSPASSM
jgi:hypothetical protein